MTGSSAGLPPWYALPHLWKDIASKTIPEKKPELWPTPLSLPSVGIEEEEEEKKIERQKQDSTLVKKIIRLGSFHGRDDDYYRDRYKAELWALKGMSFNGREADKYFDESTVPFSGSRFSLFRDTKFPEAVMILESHGGILVS